MKQGYETIGKTRLDNIAAREPFELLLILASAVAILLTGVLFAIEWSQGISDSRLPGAVTSLVIGVLLGTALWFSALIAKKNRINGAIVAAAISAILIALGGLAGTIAGVLGLIGAILAAASPYLPTPKER